MVNGLHVIVVRWGIAVPSSSLGPPSYFNPSTSSSLSPFVIRSQSSLKLCVKNCVTSPSANSGVVKIPWKANNVGLTDLRINLIFDISFIEACYKNSYTNAICGFADNTAEAMRVVKKNSRAIERRRADASSRIRVRSKANRKGRSQRTHQEPTGRQRENY